MGQLKHFLRVVGADQEEDGAFKIAGDVAAFMGDTRDSADVVVSSEAVYFTQGQPHNLAANLRQTSYGLGIMVIA